MVLIHAAFPCVDAEMIKRINLKAELLFTLQNVQTWKHNNNKNCLATAFEYSYTNAIIL